MPTLDFSTNIPQLCASNKFQDKKSYLSHFIIDSFPRILDEKIIIFQPVLIAACGRMPKLTKLVLIL